MKIQNLSMRNHALFTAIIGIALILTACGNHNWEDIEDIVFGSSSSDYSSSSLKPSSSSLALSSSSSANVSLSSSTPSSSSLQQSSSSLAENGSLFSDNNWKKYAYKAQTTMAKVSTYTVEAKEYKAVVGHITEWFEADEEKEATIYYVLPKNITDDTKVLLGIPGDGMTSDSFTKSLRYLAEKENIAVVSPLWYSKYPAPAPDKVFEDFVVRFGLKAKKYILFGFSAGGGFTFRCGQVCDSKYIDYVINHSPAYWAKFVCSDANICSNANEASKYESILSHNFWNRKTYITIGSTETAYNRLPNAINLYETGKAYSQANNLAFPWKLMAMEGVGHTVSNTTLPYILDIIKGIADIEPINNGGTQ